MPSASIWPRHVARLALASLLVTSCAENPVEPGGSGASAADLAFCADETNRLRASVGRPALTRSAALETFGAQAAESDHRSGQPHAYWGQHHTGSASAENQVNRWSMSGSVRATLQRAIAGFWSEGPGGPHYENIIRSTYTEIGCGVYVDGTVLTFVQEFRRP